MAEMQDLNDPWLVAVWPGMGNVALTAGGYLARNLNAQLVGGIPSNDYFEIEHVDVSGGLATAGRLPRSMFFLWKDPHQRHDLVLFIGESQPRDGGYRLCQQILERAREWHVSRVITFAAMATQLHPTSDPRVFAAATDIEMLAELEELEIEVLQDGQISGLNGTLLAAAAEHDISGMCLLGELPYFAVNVPNPKASQAVLEVFAAMADIRIDLEELAEQAKVIEEQLVALLERLSQGGEAPPGIETEEFGAAGFTPPGEPEPEPEEKPSLDPAAKQRIEHLFDQARHDRTKAFQLKQELDRLGVFDEYEDRFLDLFKKAD